MLFAECQTLALLILPCCDGVCSAIASYQGYLPSIVLFVLRTFYLIKWEVALYASLKDTFSYGHQSSFNISLIFFF